MEEMFVEEFKINFSEIIEKVKAGERVAVISEKDKQVIGYFIPETVTEKPKRELKILAGKSKVIFQDDFEMSDDEFKNS